MQLLRWTVASLILTASAGAQRPTSALARARALAERVDTAGALAVLDSAVRANPRDAAAWHARHLLLFETVRPAVREGFRTDQASIKRLQAADSSIRMAQRLAPDSGRFALSRGRWANFSSFIWLRAQAGDEFERALAAARRTGDRVLAAEALDELGMIRWRRYESLADRTPPREQMNFSGWEDYTTAVDHFTAALVADPLSERATRHVFMALAERKVWEQLRRNAGDRLRAVPGDGNAWLARGLASWRLRDRAAAAASFDSALARLGRVERARYTNVGRLMTARDSAAYAALRGEGQAEAERIYWAHMDPLALTAENEHRLEYLSRVAYSELRWTSEDQHLRGVDSDRGQVHVRYGPPDRIAAVPATATAQYEASRKGFTPPPGFEWARPPGGSADGAPPLRTTTPRAIAPEEMFTAITWTYNFGVRFLTFRFNAAPTYGTASFAYNDRYEAEQLRTEIPVLWENVPVTRGMEPVPVQVARFRAAGDSSDVMMIAALPVTAMARGVDLARGTLDVGLHVYGRDARVLLRDTTRETVPFTRDDTSHRRVWQLRLPPMQQLSYRVEALQEESERAARGMGTLDVTAERGFGVSDVLVVERAAPRDTARVARWSDLLLVPSAGVFRAGRPFDIVWETYELGVQAGTNRYEVALTLTLLERIRTPGSNAGMVKWALNVRDRVASVLRRAEGTQQAALAFERQRPAAPVTLDFLTLELGQVPAGRYRLMVRTTDRATNRTASAERELRVVE